jgi:hypothetical protein
VHSLSTFAVTAVAVVAAAIAAAAIAAADVGAGACEDAEFAGATTNLSQLLRCVMNNTRINIINNPYSNFIYYLLLTLL